MKLKRNQIVRIGANDGVSIRYWGRLAQVKTFAPVRCKNGKFKGSVVVVQPRNKKKPLVASKKVILER